MKLAVRLMTVVVIASLLIALPAQPANAALDQFGKLEIFGGAEREPGGSGGGRGKVLGLGVLPLLGNFGLQGIVSSGWGSGWRFGLGAGPILDFGGGKVGFIVAYQYRAQGTNNLVFLNPSLALYMGQANMNFWYSHPVAGSNSYNRLQWTVDYFNASDWWGPFLRRDNVELTGGLQVNSFAGSGNFSTGVGPVLGLSFMPLPGVAVNLVHAVFDFNQSRYRVDSGVEVFFGRGIQTLKDVRRKYLEPNQDFTGGGAGSRSSSSNDCEKRCVSDRNLKANIESVDARELLARLATIPIQKWNYKSDDPSVRHIGPMAQDFHAAFSVGGSDRMISMLDSNGIALASIQALYQMVEEKDQRIAALESRLEGLEKSEKGTAHAPLTMDLLSGWPLLAALAMVGLFVTRRRKG